MPPRVDPSHSDAFLAWRFRAARTWGLARRAARRVLTSGLRRAPTPAQAPIARMQPAGLAPRVLVVDAHWPRPDLDSGSVRIVALIRLLSELGMTPALFSDDFRAGALEAPIFPTEDVRDVRSAIEWIRRHRDDLKLVVLSRHTVARHWLPLIRSLLPHTPVVFDTVDLHFLREMRQAHRSGSAMLERLASMTRRDELALAGAVDATWVVSEVERSLLAAARPFARIECISNIVDPLRDPPGMHERRDFVFVGNFRHEPNVDAAAWLVTLWPRIRLHCADAKLHVVGPYMPEELAGQLAALEGVVVTGYMRDIAPCLLTARVMLAPLRYGAGVKGKLNSAFAHGLPVNATSCAAEGMQLVDQPVAVVADEADEFVEGAIQLYTNEALWWSVRNAAMQCVELHFSTQSMRDRLATNLQKIGVELEHP